MTHGHDSNLTRRGFLAGIAAAAGSAILAACGGSSSPTATTAATVAATKPAAAASPAATTAAASAASPATAAAAPTTAAAAASAVSPTSAAASAPAAAGTAAPAASGGSTVLTAPTAAASTGAAGGQLNVVWTKPATIHPLFSTAGIEQGVERQMFGALIRINDKLEPVPDLAEKIETSADAKNYTFTLKKNLVFSDGKPLTSKDVVFTIQRAVDKRTGSYWRGRLLAIDGAADYGDQKTDTIKGLTAPDDYTVKMTLTVPDSTWLITLGDFAGPEHPLQGRDGEHRAGPDGEVAVRLRPHALGRRICLRGLEGGPVPASQAQRDLCGRPEGEARFDLLQSDLTARRRPRATRLGRSRPDGSRPRQRGGSPAQKREPDRDQHALAERHLPRLQLRPRQRHSRTSACGRR